MKIRPYQIWICAALTFICGWLSATPTTQQWLQSVADSAPGPLATIRAVYAGGAEYIATPTPPATKPTLPDWTAGKKIVGVSGNFDGFDYNASSNTIYVLPAGARFTAGKSRTINKPGVHIIGEGLTPTATIDVTATKWKQQLFTFTDTAKDCGVHNLIISGHDGAEFIKLEGTPGFTLEYVKQVVNSVHRGGITPLAANGSKNLLIRHIDTESVGRYGLYIGDGSKRGNLGGALEDCQLGPIKMLESEKSSGADKDTSTLNGGAKYEHPFRIYGGVNWKISRCTFTNPHTLKNAAKLMSGDGYAVTDCTFDGVSRFGRDVNDPPNYKLLNCSLTRCTFTDLVRIDPGADVTITDSTLTKLQVENKGKVRLVNAKVAGQLTTRVISK
jgi:hypothetical protein